MLKIEDEENEIVLTLKQTDLRKNPHLTFKVSLKNLKTEALLSMNFMISVL